MLRTPRWTVRLYILCCAALAVTGLAQMPIFKRYYIADIPGLGWTADFALTHAMHYAFAAVLLALIFMHLTRYVLARRWRLTWTGALRAAFLVILVGTGFVRVFKNMPDVFFSPTTVMLVDWTHLGAAMGLGLGALAARLAGRQPYVRPRSSVR